MTQLDWEINVQRFHYLTYEDLDALVAQFKAEGGKTIKDNPGRTVKEMTCNGAGAVFVKRTKIHGLPEILKHFFLPKRISREWRIMNQLTGLGIPTACPVAMGTDRKGGLLREAFLVTQSLGNMVTLHTYYRQKVETSSPDQALAIKDDLIQGLAHFMHSLHCSGLLHHDIHIENILLPAEAQAPLSFYLIDLYKVQIGKSADAAVRMLNLARLLFSASASKIFTREEQKEFMRRYYSLDKVSELELSSLQGVIFRLVEKLSKERVRSRGRKSFKPGKFFATASAPGEFIIYRRDFPIINLYPIVSLHHEITRPFKEIAHPHPEMLPPFVLKASRRSIVTRVKLGNSPAQSFCVKEERNDPEKPSVRFFFTRSRNRKSWENSNKMLLRDLPAPRCLALQEKRRFGFRVGSLLIMEYFEDLIPLNTYILQAFQDHLSPPLFQKKRAFMSFLADFVRNLHEEGIYQGDLKSNNLLIRERGYNEWECYIVDLDCIHFGKKVSLSRRIKNLAQLNASVAECMSPSNRVQFLRYYDALCQWDKKKRKELYGKILAVSRKRKTHFYGVRFDEGSRRFAGKVTRA